MEAKQEKVKKVEPEIKIKLEKLRLLCRKCNTEWIEERPLGFLVRSEKNNNYLINRDNPEKKKYFKCPKCRARSKIARLSMRPLMKDKIREIR